jgi:hypothetical protein
MKRDDIVRMARLAATGAAPLAIFTIEELEAFAALVASAEREACAKIADTAEPYKSADLIRARGLA